jgi:NADPH2:quinone reductase
MIGRLCQKYPDWFSENLKKLFGFLVRGKIKQIIAARMPLAEVRRAHDLIDEAGVQGKIMLIVKEMLS